MNTMIKPKRLTLTIPPKSGPNPQGLNINYNTVKTVRTEKINGRDRKNQYQILMNNLHLKNRVY
jgi:hypothetical protein